MRQLTAGAALAHVRARLVVPAGPLAGELDALASLVLVEDAGEHRIAAFHNTPIA